MKGIILAGGTGSRLWPLTLAVSKQLLPVYDKPMIYYPLSVLMLAGIREVLVISTPDDLPGFRRLLGSGSSLGMKFSYVEQPKPEGLAQAFLLGREFIGDDAACLILGDNIFYGQGFTGMLNHALKLAENENKASIFAYSVEHPERYGVVTLDSDGKPVDIVEKPSRPAGDKAVVGLYFFPQGVSDVAANVRPSERGELEITSVIEHYIKSGQLEVQCFGRGFAWLDTGVVDSLTDASNFVQAIQKRQGLLIAAIEEVAFRRGFITAGQLGKLADGLLTTEYGRYLKRVADAHLHSL